MLPNDAGNAMSRLAANQGHKEEGPIVRLTRMVKPRQGLHYPDWSRPFAGPWYWRRRSLGNCGFHGTENLFLVT